MESIRVRFGLHLEDLRAVFSPCAALFHTTRLSGGGAPDRPVRWAELGRSSRGPASLGLFASTGPSGGAHCEGSTPRARSSGGSPVPDRQTVRYVSAGWF